MLKKHINQALDSFHRQKYRTLNNIELSQKNMIDNLEIFKSLNPGLKVMSVLKANAYGHGLKQVAKILNSTDCEFIAVDGYFEANRIKDITKHKILVLGYILPSNTYLLDNKKCSFVVQDKDGLKALGNFRNRFKVHLEINTGMNRLGIEASEIQDYLETLKSHKNLELEGVMTHLADADNPDFSYSAKQLKMFDDCVKSILDSGFKPKYIHIAQTAGSTKIKSKYANCLRIGIGLYGINPLSVDDINYPKLSGLKPVLELKSTIIKIRNLRPGEKISYNGIYETTVSTKVATLPLGYYEWVPRELSNVGVITADKYKLPIRGRVCMNHTMIDVTDTKLKVGDEVTLISSDVTLPNSIKKISKQTGLSTYTLLTRTAESVRRNIVEA